MGVRTWDWTLSCVTTDLSLITLSISFPIPYNQDNNNNA